MRDQKASEYREKFANPYIAASLGYVDEVIDPKETRIRLIRASTCYKTSGTAIHLKSMGIFRCEETLMFRKVLIANRGEIAIRVMRGCRELGLSPVAVYSKLTATRSMCRWRRSLSYRPAPATESYLVIDHIIEAALVCGAEAIHPGYGFLAENAKFAKACEQGWCSLVRRGHRLDGGQNRRTTPCRRRGCLWCQVSITSYRTMRMRTKWLRASAIP